MRRLLPIVAAVCLLLLPAIGAACLWDYDTLKMERARFPDTLELITGKFLRHSPEFYRWRIADRLKRLESDPANVRLLDDLAAAYDKVGEHDKAIETAERTERIQSGRYETAANLGTFLFHAGRLNDGLPHIDRALEINPNAHFGREKYQKLLVEYVLKCREERGSRLPLADVKLWKPELDEEHKRGTVYAHTLDRFQDFLKDVNPGEPPDELLDPRTDAYAARMDGRRAEIAGALKGVLGMMKFGDHKSPILLEALGTLLLNGGREDAKFLSCRAFLKASYEVPDGPARTAYRAMAESALTSKAGGKFATQITLKELEPDFKAELADARQWYEEVRAKELTAIRDGRNPEVEFDKLYDASNRPASKRLAVARGRFKSSAWCLSELVLGWSSVGSPSHDRDAPAERIPITCRSDLLAAEGTGGRVRAGLAPTSNRAVARPLPGVNTSPRIRNRPKPPNPPNRYNRHNHFDWQKYPARVGCFGSIPRPHAPYRCGFITIRTIGRIAKGSRHAPSPPFPPRHRVP